MIKQILFASLLTIVGLNAGNAVAMSRSQADHTGYRVALKACEVVWEGNVKTQLSALQQGLNRLEFQQTIERFNKMMELSQAYGKDHQLVASFWNGYYDTIMQTCLEEYKALPLE